MKNPSPINRHTLYAWLRTIVVVAVTLVAMETFVVMGIVMPTRIKGSSMAPALVGAHARLSCPHCEHEFDVAADQIPNSRQFWCPDCDERFTNKVKLFEPGERMWIDRVGLVFSDPERYDVIVAREPIDSSSYCIKRVLGLPGEHVDFDRGDLVIDGEVVRKSLDEQLRLRQLVHEERNTLRQWHSEDDANWQWQEEGAWQHKGAATRLTFSRSAGREVTDELGVNQTVPAMPHEVTDLMVTCDAKLEAMASLTFVAEFPDGQTMEHSIKTPSKCSAVWSLFDRRAMLAIDGRVVWSETQPGRWSSPPRLSLVASGGVEIRNLTVWRDIFFHTRPVDQWPTDGVRLTGGQFFVAGDNQAVSDDCRSWPDRSLPRELLIGVPIGVK